MKRRLPLPAMAMLLAGCSTPPVPHGCGHETFDAFLPRYMRERPFASERTAFPLETIAALQEKKSLVSREQFAKAPLLADMLKADKLSTRQAVTPAGAELTVFRPDSDALVYHYRFRRQDGCWVLWQFEDASL